MKLKQILFLIGVLAIWLMPLFTLAQDVVTAPVVEAAPQLDLPKTKVSIDMEDMAWVISIVLLLGGVIKNYIPKIDNNYIPLITWAAGILLYQSLSNGWGDIRQWMAAGLTVASATGLHSATRSTVAVLPAGAARVGLFLAFFLLPLGCGTVQVKEGHDPIIVHAEYLEENGLNTLNQFLQWERNHEAAWRQKNPGIHAFAQSLRADKLGDVGPGEQYLIDLSTLKKKYKADKTAANGDQVKLATQTLLNVLNKARQHMGLAPLQLPGVQPSVRDLMKNAPTNAPPAN